MINKLPMTTAGFTALETELKYCREVERPRIIQQLADARTPEDLSENVDYRNATELQSQNELRIAELENKLSRAEVIDTSNHIWCYRHAVGAEHQKEVGMENCRRT